MGLGRRCLDGYSCQCSVHPRGSAAGLDGACDLLGWGEQLCDLKGEASLSGPLGEVSGLWGWNDTGQGMPFPKGFQAGTSQKVQQMKETQGP